MSEPLITAQDYDQAAARVAALAPPASEAQIDRLRTLLDVS